jgi:cyclopropane-fatty-acyl-phospholipid synthase
VRPIPPTAAQRRALHVIATMLAQLQVGALEVTLPDGRRRVFGDPASELRSDIEVADWRFFTRLLHGASVGVGESYMLGEWTSRDLVSLFRIVIANRRALRRITPAALLNIAGDKASTPCGRTGSGSRGATSPPTTTSPTRCTSCSSTTR